MNTGMNMTKREFRIAAVAALFGFFLCYFLVGSTTPPRPKAPKLQIIATLPEPPATNTPSFQFSVPTAKVQARPQMQTATYKYVVGPFAALSPARKDLFSARYNVDVDLSDLQ